MGVNPGRGLRHTEASCPTDHATSHLLPQIKRYTAITFNSISTSSQRWNYIGKIRIVDKRRFGRGCAALTCDVGDCSYTREAPVCEVHIEIRCGALYGMNMVARRGRDLSFQICRACRQTSHILRMLHVHEALGAVCESACGIHNQPFTLRGNCRPTATKKPGVD